MKNTKNTQDKEVSNKAHKRMSGVVVSNKMTDTVVVDVSRFVKHPKYGKYISTNTKFKAHNPGNTKAIGDKVTIEECAPISKDKHFKVIEA